MKFRSVIKLVVISTAFIYLSALTGAASGQSERFVIDKSKLITQFDNWIFANGKYQKVFSISPEFMGRESTNVNTYFADYDTFIKLRVAQKKIYAFEILPRMSVVDHRYAYNYKPSEASIKRNKSIVSIFGIEEFHYTHKVKEFEAVLRDTKNISYKYVDFSTNKFCKYRKYILFQEEDGNLLQKVKKSNLISFRTFSYVDMKGIKSLDDEKRALSCVFGAIYFHFGASNIYRTATERMEYLVFGNNANYIHLENLFPLWAIYQTDIKSMMGRDQALIKAESLSHKWIAKFYLRK